MYLWRGMVAWEVWGVRRGVWGVTQSRRTRMYRESSSWLKSWFETKPISKYFLAPPTYGLGNGGWRG